ncbi:MAG: hypothetical protein L6R37_002724 [Teloschistes peruensis]|nr:MAG: hypothetical protein L6R37_002724 [Teloschistes peruensis]
MAFIGDTKHGEQCNECNLYYFASLYLDLSVHVIWRFWNALSIEHQRLLTEESCHAVPARHSALALDPIFWLHGSDFWRDGARKLVCLERNPLTKPFRGTDLQIAYELHRTTSLDRAIFCLTEQSECAQGFNFPKTGKITFIDALHLDHGVKEVEDVLLKKIKEFETSNNRVLLVLDGIDFLLAGTEARLDEILGMIWELREVWRQPLY